MKKNQKIILSVICLILIIGLVYLGVKNIKNNFSGKGLDVSQQAYFVDPKNIDESVKVFADQFTGENVKVNKSTNSIDMAYSIKGLLDKSPACSESSQNCQSQIGEVLRQIRLLTSQGYKFDDASYNIFVELMVAYKLNIVELNKVVQNSNIEQIKELWKKYRMKPIEERIKPFLDGTESDPNIVVCKTLNLLSCKNLYYQDLSGSCTEIKKNKCNF